MYKIDVNVAGLDHYAIHHQVILVHGPDRVTVHPPRTV